MVPLSHVLRADKPRALWTAIVESFHGRIHLLLRALRTTIVQSFPGLRKFAGGECIYPERELTAEARPSTSSGRGEPVEPRRTQSKRGFLIQKSSELCELSVSLMKISSRSDRQFLQGDLITESLQPVEAAFCYCLTVTFIKVVSTEIGISLFAS